MLLYFEPTLRCNSLATEQRNDHQRVRFWKIVQPLIDHGLFNSRDDSRSFPISLAEHK
jgi:hypothetical protein